jgi:hypothetical protein
VHSRMRLWLAAAVLLLPTVASSAPDYRPGEVFEIRRESRMERATNDGSKGSSFDRSTLTVRVIGRTDSGLEVEYDLPTDVPAEDRARQWEFPARVLRPTSGPAQLLNRPDLEARVTAWLKAADLPREACGQWYFTWNAFKVECEPDTVIATLEAFDPRPDVFAAGVLVGDPAASEPAALVLKSKSAKGTTFVADLAVDPEAIRKTRAEADVVVGQVTRKPVTLEAALKSRSADAVSGTMRITFETDPAGRILRRTKVTTLTTTGPAVTGPGTRTETQTTTEVLDWRRILDASAP